MASLPNQLHFVLFPFMAQGHMIPMIDIAKVLANRGVIITIVTTPVNAARFKTTLARAQESGLPIRVIQLRFPCEELGLPKGCENVDLLPSSDMPTSINFLNAIGMLQEQVENLFQELMPRPCCIISDFCLPYTSHIASKFDIPRISFHGTGCLFLLCLRSINIHRDVIESSSTSDSEYVVLPGLPGQIEFTKAQLPLKRNPCMQEFFDEILEADSASYGAVVNSIEELEPEFVQEYKNVKGGKVWCIGPVSLCNKDVLDKAQRGNDASITEHECLKWLDSQEPRSVVYVCLGSLCNLPPQQLIELGLGLEESNKPFLWVIRGNAKSKQVENWILESGFKERVKTRGFLIHGFAPQVLILSHGAIGGFITHCGWNSTLEGLAAGIPLMTWPLFGDQFCNEKLAVQVLKVGVRVGVERLMEWGEEEKIGVLVKKEDVKKGVDMLMDEGEEGQARRQRAKEIGNMAKRAVEGGSSYLNTTMLIEDIMQQSLRDIST